MKTKKNLMHFLFYLCVFLFVLFFFFGFSKNKNRIDIPLFGGMNADIRINIEPAANYIVYADNMKLPLYQNLPFNSYVTYAMNNYPVKKIFIKGENIDNIVIASGYNLFYFDKNDIEKFDKENGFYILPNNVKYFKNSRYINDIGSFHRFFTIFLSLFYNSKYYILGIIFLALGIFFHIKGGGKISINIMHILIITLVLRLSDLCPSFWADELYSVFLAGNPNLPFASVFIDPGNPPFFYILVKIWTSIFNQSPDVVRILPSLIGVLSVFMIYKFAQNKNEGLLASFMLCINVYALSAAGEVRAYSFVILFCIILSFYLFKLKDDPSVKNFVIYGLISAVSLCTHYFMAFIIFSNFIFGLFLLNKKKNFFIANLASAPPFFLYLVLTGFKKGLVDETFNSFQRPDFTFFVDVFSKYGYGILTVSILILAGIFLFSKTKRDEFLEYKYSFFTVIFVSFLSFAFSFIKPVSRMHYYICLLPYFILMISSLVFYPYKKAVLKYAVIFLLAVGILIPNSYMRRERNRLTSFDNLVDYANSNSLSPSVIFPYLNNVNKNAYGNKVSKYLISTLPLSGEKILKTIEENGGGEYYIRLDNLSLLNEVSKKYDTSFILTNKDTIIARIRR